MSYFFWRKDFVLCLVNMAFFFGQIALFSMTNDLNVKRNKLIILLNKFSTFSRKNIFRRFFFLSLLSLSLKVKSFPKWHEIKAFLFKWLRAKLKNQCRVSLHEKNPKIDFLSKYFAVLLNTFVIIDGNWVDFKSVLTSLFLRH